MNEPVLQPSPDPQHRAGHETTDASPFYIGLFALGLVLMIVLCLTATRLDLLAVRGRSAAGGPRAKPAGRRPEHAPCGDLEEQPAAEVWPTCPRKTAGCQVTAGRSPALRVVHVPV